MSFRRMIAAVILGCAFGALLQAVVSGCGSSHDNLARPTFLYSVGNPPDIGRCPSWFMGC